MKLISSLSLMAYAGVSLLPFSPANAINSNVNATAAIETRSAAIWPFDNGPGAKLYCGPHYVDASHARDAAFRDLIRQCKQNKRKIKKKVGLYGKHLTTVAYFCSYSNKGSKCDVDELKNALGYIQQDCRNNEGGHVLQVGEVHLKSWKKAYGFTNDLDSIPPCGKKGDNWGLGSDVDILVPPKKTRKSADDESDAEEYEPKLIKVSGKKGGKKGRKGSDDDSDDE